MSREIDVRMYKPFPNWCEVVSKEHTMSMEGVTCLATHFHWLFGKSMGVNIYQRWCMKTDNDFLVSGCIYRDLRIKPRLFGCRWAVHKFCLTPIFHPACLSRRPNVPASFFFVPECPNAKWRRRPPECSRWPVARWHRSARERWLKWFALHCHCCHCCYCCCCCCCFCRRCCCFVFVFIVVDVFVVVVFVVVV